MGIYGVLIFLILLGRAAFVFPLSVFSNYINRRADRISSINFKHQARNLKELVSIAWSG